MIYKVSYIKDVMGNNYLGIKFTKSQIEPYLNELEEELNDGTKFELFTENQQRRDKRDDSEYTHHMTIISVMEINQLLSKMGSELQKRIDIIMSLDITDIIFKGIGKAERAGNQAYFVVCDSPTLDEIRYSLGLESKDFHITIGFDKKDVFGVRKNQVLKKKVNSEK
jgi:hypothetical protein